MTSMSRSMDQRPVTLSYEGITITHHVDRDGFGGEETQEDVDAYCQAVADRILACCPGAAVTVDTALSRHTDIDGTDDIIFADEIKTICRECAGAVWEGGEFWTER
jgi:hypothetical protein